jgi:replicative superfamily II helicase
VCGIGLVEDVAIIVKSDTYHDNIELLEKVLGRAEQWAKWHAARLVSDKFELIHFTNPSTNDTRTHIGNDIQSDIQTDIQTDIFDYAAQHHEGNDRMPVRCHDNTIRKPSGTAGYLGVWLDKQPNINKHRQKLLAQADRSLEALRR